MGTRLNWLQFILFFSSLNRIYFVSSSFDIRHFFIYYFILQTISMKLQSKKYKLSHTFTMATGEHPLVLMYKIIIAFSFYLQVYSPIQSNQFSLEEGWNQYKSRYQESIENPDKFWANEAEKYISWFSSYTSVSDGGLVDGDVNWFANGKLNVCYNCIDKHLPGRADQFAIIWDGDEPGQTKNITYAELKREVCRIANVMKSKGVKMGDVVTVYMPMIPELAMTMLACARIGAIHSVVFAGFSAESLRGRVQDCNSRFLFTVDEGLRGGKVLKLKGIVDDVRT